MCRPDYLTQIENRLTNAPAGEVFIPSDFGDISDTTAVRKALSRLTESEKIRRIIRGVYDRPRFSNLLQEYEAPNMEQVAKAIARNFGWHIVRLEIGALAAWTPTAQEQVTSYAAQTYSRVFQNPSTTILTVLQERTFWETGFAALFGAGTKPGVQIWTLPKVTPDALVVSEQKHGTRRNSLCHALHLFATII